MIISLETLSKIPDEIKSKKLKEYEHNQKEYQNFLCDIKDRVAKGYMEKLDKEISKRIYLYEQM